MNNSNILNALISEQEKLDNHLHGNRTNFTLLTKASIREYYGKSS